MRGDLQFPLQDGLRYGGLPQLDLQLRDACYERLVIVGAFGDETTILCVQEAQMLRCGLHRRIGDSTPYIMFLLDGLGTR